MHSFTIARFLAQDEALRLKVLLAENNIDSVAKQYGLSRIFGGLGYFQILVSPAEKSAAASVVADFEAALRAERTERAGRSCRECPLCNSDAIIIKEKRNIIDRLRFAGVTVRRCMVCNTQWYT